MAGNLVLYEFEMAAADALCSAEQQYLPGLGVTK